VSVAVKAGDVIAPGQELAVVEAMKMQNMLRSERAGKVKEVFHQLLCNCFWINLCR
jgi:propionyl-CoA carboxylase alpha chain